MAKRYHMYLKPINGGRPSVKFERPPTTKILFKNLAEYDDYRQLSKIYDSYCFYSKYDHFGVFYFTTSRKPIQDRVNQMASCINLFVGYNSLLSLYLSDFSGNIDELEKHYKIAEGYMREHGGS